MSLRTGTEFITFSFIINKLSGLYGVLALLTGIHLSPLQLSMYLYSLLALALASYLAPHIRRQSPLQCLALAWLYVLDSFINAAYTLVFGVGWFLVLAQHNSPHPSEPGGLGVNGNQLGGAMMNDTAGFTNPSFTVTSVDVGATSVPGTIGEQDGTLVGHPPVVARDFAAATPAAAGALHTTILQPGSIASITVIATLWLIRLYAMLVVLTYARRTLRQHIATTSQTSLRLQTGSSSEIMAEDPFAVGREKGQGWSGRLGRLMLSIGRGYWLGADDNEGRERVIGGRAHKDGEAPATGVFERERRRRAGTGPPPHIKTQSIQMDSLDK